MKFYLLFPHFIWFWFWSTIIVMTIMIKDDNRLPFFIFSFHILICPQRKTNGWGVIVTPSLSGMPWFVLATFMKSYKILLLEKTNGRAFSFSQRDPVVCRSAPTTLWNLTQEENIATIANAVPCHSFLMLPMKDCFQQCISLRLLVSDIRVTYGAAKKSKDQTFNFFISIIVTMRRLALVL